MLIDGLLVALAVALIVGAYALRQWRKRQAFRRALAEEGIRIHLTEEDFRKAQEYYGMAEMAREAGFLYNHVLTCPLETEDCPICQELASRPGLQGEELQSKGEGC